MRIISRIMLLIFLLCCGKNQLMAQWVQTDGPEGGNAMCLTSIDTMLFVGTENGVFCSADNGVSWDPTGLKNRIVVSLAEMPIDDSGMNLFAGTLLGGVYISSDNGISWSEVNFGLGNLNINTLVVQDTILFAGTDEGVFLSPTNGAYWIPVSTGLTNMSINTLTFIGTNLYAGTNEGLFVSTNNGTSWTPTGLTEEAVRALVAIDTDLFVGTSSSGVLRSTDNGANWEVVSDPGMDKSVPALAVIGSDLYAGTHQGIYRTPTKGDYWIPANTGLTNTDVETLYVRGTDLFAGTYGGVYGSTNNGTSWTERNTGLKNTVVLSLITNGDDLYAGTRNGVYRSNNSGNNWTLLAPFWVCSITVDGTNLYAGTWNHLVYSLNNGASWDFLHLSDTIGRIFSLAIMDSYIFAGAEGGGVFRIRYNAPGSWTILSTGQPNATVNCLAVSGSVLFAGTENGVYLSSDHGENWTAVNTGLTHLDVRALALNGSDLFAGTGDGVFRSTNNGASWTPVNNGLTGLALDVLSFVFSDNNLFAGTWRGGVFLSKNNGASWAAVNTGLMNSDIQPSSVVHSLAIAGTNLYAGTRGAAVWHRPLSEMLVPKLSIVDSVLNQPEFIEATSTDNGIIYLVPENTNRDLTSIRGVCIDSVAAIANTVVSINISGLGNGRYWLYARDESNNISEYKGITITGVGIENMLAGQIRIYPTPTSKLITIQVEEPGEFTIAIISTNGQQIHNEKMEGNKHQLDLSSFQKGVYLITIRSKDFIATKKIIKL
jgi:ligand-binding sensor domain-containing protein